MKYGAVFYWYLAFTLFIIDLLLRFFFNRIFILNHAVLADQTQTKQTG